LDILDRNNELGAEIFSALFKKGNPSLILKFLDEETSLWEDLQVIRKCPKRLFVKALIRLIIKPRK
jgi:lycopene beta-cyclase